MPGPFRKTYQSRGSGGVEGDLSPHPSNGLLARVHVSCLKEAKILSRLGGENDGLLRAETKVCRAHFLKPEALTAHTPPPLVHVFRQFYG